MSCISACTVVSPSISTRVSGELDAELVPVAVNRPALCPDVEAALGRLAGQAPLEQRVARRGGRRPG